MPMFMFCCHNVNGCSIAGKFRCWGSRFIGGPLAAPHLLVSVDFLGKNLGIVIF